MAALCTHTSSSDNYFSAFQSLILVAILAIAPFASVPWYAFVAGLTAVIPAYLTSANTANWLNVIFGVSVIFVALQGNPVDARGTPEIL